ncbi:MAG TPA: glycosyltransferase family A protein [Gemmatimonadales bacterium]|nr:glycosyltransferase family A protein [Gemmatimonadales bacterium]
MPEPLVSIVTPTFRHEQFIEHCLRSVLAQSYRAWELIVIDDASPDNTAGIVQKFAARDPRIKLVQHQANYGAARLCETYNEGLSLCRGELIAVLEGDDEWVPTKLARQVPVFADRTVALCYADYDEITAEEFLIIRHGLADAAGVARSGLKENLRFFSALKSFGANTVMIRRSDLLSIGGFVDGSLPLVDYPTWLKLATKGDFVRIPFVLGKWRRHPDSVYWASEYSTVERLRQHFLEYLHAEHANLLSRGVSSLELDALALNPARALEERYRSRPYFEGKYRLVMGQRGRAILPFGRAILSRGTTPRHRLGAVAGILAAMTSPRLVLSLSRMLQRTRSGQ